MKLGQRVGRGELGAPSRAVVRVVVVSADDRLRDWVLATYGAFEGESSSLAPGSVLRCWPSGAPAAVPSFAREIAAHAPELVLLGSDLSLDDSIALAQVLDREHPEITCVLIAPRTAQTLDLALRVGTRGVIDPSTDTATMQRILADVLDVASARRQRIGSPADAAASGPRSRVVTVLAAKGGVGKTMLAANLATCLARQFPNEVAVVDLDLQFGDVATALGLDPTQTIADTVGLGAKLDATAIKAYLTTRPSVGLHSLCAPLMPAEADELTADHVGRLIDLLASQFRYVVIDTTAGIDEFALQALDRSSDLIVMTSTDVPSIRAAAKEVQVLEMLGLDRLRWHVVLNRADARVGLAVEDIEATIGRRITHRIPSSRALPLSVNHGVPLVESDPKNAVSRVIAELTADIAERAERPARRRDR